MNAKAKNINLVCQTLSMLHRFLFWLSRREGLKDLMMRFSFARRAARRFVAGEDLHEALDSVAHLNYGGCSASIDLLGEGVTNEEEARGAVQDYLRILDEIAEHGVDSDIAVKLTQLGLAISKDLCCENVGTILDRAKENDNFVYIDMEGSMYAQDTIDIYLALRRRYRNVGVALQAMLYRSEDDLERIIEAGGTVRLVKGAYREPKDIAYPKKKDVDGAYVRLMIRMFSDDAQKRGAYVAIGTHDERIITLAKMHTAKEGIPKDRFEFQMLYGIRGGLQQRLAEEGYRMRVYTPFGSQWYPYFMRRMAERPANVWFVLRNVVR